MVNDHKCLALIMKNKLIFSNFDNRNNKTWGITLNSFFRFVGLVRLSL